MAIVKKNLRMGVQKYIYIFIEYQFIILQKTIEYSQNTRIFNV